MLAPKTVTYVRLAMQLASVIFLESISFGGFWGCTVVWSFTVVCSVQARTGESQDGKDEHNGEPEAVE